MENAIDEIRNYTWICGIHGELETEDIGVSVSGQLVCNMCSINKEMQPHKDIDPKIKMDLDSI